MTKTETHDNLRDILTLILGIVIVIGLILISAGFALAGDETTLLSTGIYDNGGMGGFQHGIGNFAGETHYVSTWQAQWIINHSVGIGLMGYSVGPGDRFDMTINGTEYDVAYEAMGVDFECFKMSEYLMHPIMGLTIGGGFIETQDQLGLADETAGFFMLTPRAGVEMNVTKWMRVNGTFSYRAGMGLESNYFSNKDISGYAVMFGMKFGSF